MKGFRSSIFHTFGADKYEYIQDALLVTKQGKVVAVGEYSELRPTYANLPITSFKDTLLIPGFVDVHTHYPQYYSIASYGEKLIDWLNKYIFIEEQKFSDYEYASNIASWFFDELVKNGTTTAMSFCTTHPVSVDAYFEEAKSRNMRMGGGKVMMDANAPKALLDTAERSVQESEELIKKWHNIDRLTYALTPRFAPTSSKEQLQKCGRLYSEYSKSGVLLQTHLNENLGEIEWVKSLFGEEKSYLQVYEDFGLVGENSIFAHCIYNDKRELEKLSSCGAKISLCPRSNLFLGSGLFSVADIKKHSISFALASDVGAGDSFSMLGVMNEAYKICQLQGYALSPIEAFYLSTLAGAQVLGCDKQIGNFEKGKEADFIVMDLRATKIIEERIKRAKNIEDILFSLMILGDDRVIQEVFVLGERIYKKGCQ